MHGYRSRTLIRLLLVFLVVANASWPILACAIDEGAQQTDCLMLAAGTDGTSPRGRLAAADKERPGASAKNRTKQSETVWKSDELSMPAIGMSVGDIDGDGNNELVIIDPGTVHVYRIVDGRLRLISELSLSPLELKSVDVAKIRKQGPPRIYVSAQNRGAISSVVLEYRGGKLETVIKDIRYYLRVIEYPTRGPFLLGQLRGMRRTYEGPIWRLADKGHALESTGRFGVPLKIPIFGFAIGDLEGTREPHIAVYDREDHLRIYTPQGKRLYRSTGFYGGSDVMLRPMSLDRKSDEAGLETTQDTEPFRPRIMSLDLKQDGKYEIVVITHESKTGRYLARTKMLEEGQVQGLVWNGDATEERWSTPRTQGMITDFAVANLPGMSSLRLVTLERKKTDWLSFIRSRSQVRAYDLKHLREKGPGPGGRDE